MNDPVIVAVIGGAAAVIVFSILARFWRGRREAVRDFRIRKGVRQQRGHVQRRESEMAELAGRIIATSSTDTIAGYRVVRQIEAVFADGQAAPSEAVSALKAAAAEKGANAVINLQSVRTAAGKYLAQGDAAVVEPLADEPKSLPALPRTPPIVPDDR